MQISFNYNGNHGYNSKQRSVKNENTCDTGAHPWEGFWEFRGT